MTMFKARIWRGAWLAAALAGPVWIEAQAPAAPPPPPPARAASRGGFLGVGIQDVGPDRARDLKLPGERGVEITRVRPHSPAEQAGLKPGDVVLEYNGTKIDNIEQLSRVVMETMPGHEAKIDIYRNGSTQTVVTQIGQYPAPGFFPPDVPMPPNFPDYPRIIQAMKSPMLGVEAESVDGQLAQYFGVKEGVLVRSVMKDSAAEKAGIKAGDVIVRVEDAHTATPADISAKLRSMGGKQVSVTLVRDRKETGLSVNVELPPEHLGRTGRAQLVDPNE